MEKHIKEIEADKEIITATMANLETGDNNNNDDNHEIITRVPVVNFHDYYKEIFCNKPILQINRSEWFSLWHENLKPSASVENICIEMNKNHANKLFVVFPVTKDRVKILHGLFYDETKIGNHYKMVGWDTTKIPQIVDNCNRDDVNYDLEPEPVWFEGYWFCQHCFNPNANMCEDLIHIPTIEMFKSIVDEHHFANLRGGPDTQPLTIEYAKELCNIMFLHPYIYINCIEDDYRLNECKDI